MCRMRAPAILSGGGPLYPRPSQWMQVCQFIFSSGSSSTDKRPLRFTMMLCLYIFSFVFLPFQPARPAAQFCGSFNIFSCCLPGRAAGPSSGIGISIGISVSIGFSLGISSAISPPPSPLLAAGSLKLTSCHGNYRRGPSPALQLSSSFFPIYILFARIVSCRNRKKLRQVITI